jgi:hypothetical protein
LETKAEDAEDAADEFEAEGPTEKLA